MIALIYSNVSAKSNEDPQSATAPKSPFLSLKTPPSVLTKPSATLYPEKKRTKKLSTPLTNVPPTQAPGSLPGYYPPPHPPLRQKSQLQLLSHHNTHQGGITPTTTTPTSTSSHIVKEKK